VAAATASANASSLESDVAAVDEEERWCERASNVEATRERARSEWRRQACAHRDREAGGVAMADRSLGLGEELLQGDEHFTEAAMRVGEEDEIAKQPLRPRRCRLAPPTLRVLHLRVVEQVGEAGQDVPEALHPCADRRRASFLSRRLGPPEEGVDGVVEAGDDRVDTGGAGV
jgi:hypothetical protein